MAKHPATLDELVQSFDALIHFLLIRMGVCPQDRQDLAQEVYREIIERRHMDRYDPTKGKFATYLGFIVRSVVKAARCQPDTYPPPADPVASTFERRYITADYHHRLRRYIQNRRRGPSKLKVIDGMYYDWSQVAIASRMGVDRRTVSRLRASVVKDANKFASEVGYPW